MQLACNNDWGKRKEALREESIIIIDLLLLSQSRWENVASRNSLTTILRTVIEIFIKKRAS